MKRHRLAGVILLLFIGAFCSCAGPKNVQTESIVTMKEEILNLSSDVQSVKVLFLRPNVNIDVEVSNESSEIIKSTLSIVSKYITVKTMDEVAAGLISMNMSVM